MIDALSQSVITQMYIYFKSELIRDSALLEKCGHFIVGRFYASHLTLLHRYLYMLIDTSTNHSCMHILLYVYLLSLFITFS